MLITSLRKFYGSQEALNLIFKNLNKNGVDDEPLSLQKIYNTIPFDDVLWSLNSWDYTQYCLFIADIMELIAPYFNHDFPSDPSINNAIQAIRDYHYGVITEIELTNTNRVMKNLVNPPAAPYDYQIQASIIAIYYATSLKPKDPIVGLGFALVLLQTLRPNIRHIFEYHFIINHLKAC